MAVNKTGAMFKSLTFDGEDSRDYGVYITGQAVFNAPEREVEMISIPGRNGQFALDKGRFENIEVVYPAGIFANTEAEFAEAVSNFRNLLCSKRGYVRLQDEYHPEEYRMAIYKSGLELENVALKAGEFEITFDCKPQRYLTSGETAVTVTNGGSLTNPTLFDAEPLLEVEGYGNIAFNGYNIEIANGEIGTVSLWDKSTVNSVNTSITKSFTPELFKSTDTFTFSVGVQYDEIYEEFGSVTHTSANASSGHGDNNNGSIYVWINLNCPNIPVGTPTTFTNTSTVTYDSSRTTVFNMTVVYDGAGNITYTVTTTNSAGVVTALPNSSISKCSATSTETRLGHPTYIDCELGECYKLSGTEIISLNSYIDLGSDLPKLAPGGNEFTIDNTITELKVVPKWWKV